MGERNFARDVCTTAKMLSIYQGFQPTTEASDPLISEILRFFRTLRQDVVLQNNVMLGLNYLHRI